MRAPLRRRIRKAAAALVLLCTLPICVLAAEGPERWLEPAIASYALGMESRNRDERLRHFAESERYFAEAIEAGAESADSWANLGNAALQAERLGPAILAYRRALLADPGHARASQNLAHARTLLPSWLPVPASDGVLDSFLVGPRTLSRAARSDWAAVSFAAAALLFSLAYAWRLVFPRYLAALFALAWLTLVGSTYLDSASNARGEGVVIVPETVSRAADSVNAPLRFGDSLPSGAEVRILEDRGGWLHVELHNGRDAWVAGSAIERLAESEP
jgi:hypothetical protein